MLLRLFLPACLLVVSCRATAPGPTPKESKESKESKPTTPTGSDKTPAAPPPNAFELARPAAGLEVSYRGVSLPEARRVIVLFHGYGADREDLADLSEVMDTGEGSAFVFPQAPLTLQLGGYAWFGRDARDFESGYLRAQAFIGWVRREAPQASLIVGGFSQGAMLTANLIADLPREAEAALLFSPADFLPHPPTPDTPRIPLFVSHGSRDTVLPFAGGKALHDRFQKAGFDTTWRPFDGPHTISREVLAELNTFLKSLPSH